MALDATDIVGQDIITIQNPGYSAEVWERAIQDAGGIGLLRDKITSGALNMTSAVSLVQSEVPQAIAEIRQENFELKREEEGPRYDDWKHRLGIDLAEVSAVATESVIVGNVWYSEKTVETAVTDARRQFGRDHIFEKSADTAAHLATALTMAKIASHDQHVDHRTADKSLLARLPESIRHIFELAHRDHEFVDNLDRKVIAEKHINALCSDGNDSEQASCKVDLKEGLHKLDPNIKVEPDNAPLPTASARSRQPLNGVLMRADTETAPAPTAGKNLPEEKVAANVAVTAHNDLLHRHVWPTMTPNQFN